MAMSPAELRELMDAIGGGGSSFGGGVRGPKPQSRPDQMLSAQADLNTSRQPTNTGPADTFSKAAEILMGLIGQGYAEPGQATFTGLTGTSTNAASVARNQSAQKDLLSQMDFHRTQKQGNENDTIREQLRGLMLDNNAKQAALERPGSAGFGGGNIRPSFFAGPDDPNASFQEKLSMEMRRRAASRKQDILDQRWRDKQKAAALQEQIRTIMGMTGGRNVTKSASVAPVNDTGKWRPMTSTQTTSEGILPQLLQLIGR